MMRAYSRPRGHAYTVDEIQDAVKAAAQSAPLSSEEEEELVAHLPDLLLGPTFSGQALEDAAAYPEAGIPLQPDLNMLTGLCAFTGATNAAYAQALEGTLGIPSLGSLGHRDNACKPCAFFHKMGCGTGAECSFCHLCGPDAVKQRKQDRRKKIAIVQKNKKEAKQAEAKYV